MGDMKGGAFVSFVVVVVVVLTPACVFVPLGCFQIVLSLCLFRRGTAQAQLGVNLCFDIHPVLIRGVF